MNKQPPTMLLALLNTLLLVPFCASAQTNREEDVCSQLFTKLRDLDRVYPSHYIHHDLDGMTIFVSLSGPLASDQSLECISSLRSLQEVQLHLRNTNKVVTVDGIRALSVLPQLKRLTLGSIEFVDEQLLKGVASLPTLEVLTIQSGGVQPKALQALAESRSLRDLRLCNVTGFDYSELAGLKGLKDLMRLHLNMTSVSSNAIQILESFPSLTNATIFERGGRSTYWNRRSVIQRK